MRNAVMLLTLAGVMLLGGFAAREIGIDAMYGLLVALPVWCAAAKAVDDG